MDSNDVRDSWVKRVPKQDDHRDDGHSLVHRVWNGRGWIVDCSAAQAGVCSEARKRIPVVNSKEREYMIREITANSFSTQRASGWPSAGAAQTGSSGPARRSAT